VSLKSFPIDLRRFRGRDMVRTKFSDRNVVPGSSKYVDLRTCLGKITVTQTGHISLPQSAAGLKQAANTFCSGCDVSHLNTHISVC